jgi:hypothetical protein
VSDSYDFELIADAVDEAFDDAPRLSPALRRWLAGEMSTEEARRLGLTN